MPAVLMRGETHALERVALPPRRLDPRCDCLGTRRLGHADDRTARATDLQPADFSGLDLGGIACETQMRADGAPQIASFGACSSGSSWFA
jgi:hypothetical protein